MPFALPSPLSRLGRGVLAALALQGCATTSSAPEANAGRHPCDYMPLAVGNRWQYAAHAQGAPEPKQLEVTLTGRKDGYFQDDKGGSFACTVEGLRDSRRYLLQSPLEVGRAWRSVVGVTTTEQYEIVDVGSTIGVPAGKFADTVTVRSRTAIDPKTNLENETSYAPGVGIIRIRTQVVQANQVFPQLDAELSAFIPAAAPAPAATP